MENIGLIHVYCGDGKGKTTAAIGLILRALGRQKRVVLVQLMKNRKSGEIEMLEKIENIAIFRGKDGDGFSFSMTDEQKKKTREISDENLSRALEILKRGECDLLVIDEAAGALNRGLASEEIIAEILRQKPSFAELVFTGRRMPQFITEQADYITEMRAVAHPYNKGISAREGIEF